MHDQAEIEAQLAKAIKSSNNLYENEVQYFEASGVLQFLLKKYNDRLICRFTEKFGQVPVIPSNNNRVLDEVLFYFFERPADYDFNFSKKFLVGKLIGTDFNLSENHQLIELIRQSCPEADRNLLL